MESAGQGGRAAVVPSPQHTHPLGSQPCNRRVYLPAVMSCFTSCEPGAQVDSWTPGVLAYASESEPSH
jgi:hypothetical protein